MAGRHVIRFPLGDVSLLAAELMIHPDDNERLAQLRAKLAKDPSLNACAVKVAFRDGALHLSGRTTDEKAWFAIVNLASAFASRVVDEIEMRRDRFAHVDPC